MAAAAAAGYVTWTLKDIRHHDSFSGEPKEFDNWAFPFEAEVLELGWKHLVDQVVKLETEIASDTYGPAWRITFTHSSQ